MILIAWIVVGVAIVWLLLAAWLSQARRISFRQAFLLAPLTALWRVDARALGGAEATRSVVYVVSHQSRLDPALMLSLLPDDTLHILDEYSSKAWWLEPWRGLARTSAFNPEHLFVNRRLARILRGGGRLCVYLPADITPDARTFRLYRAIARIALKADAKVVPVHVAGAAELPFALAPAGGAKRGMFPKLTVHALAPATIAELVAKNLPDQNTSSGALYHRVEETRAAGEGNLGKAA